MSFEVNRAKPTDVDELLTIFEEARAFKISHEDSSWGSEPFTISEIEDLVASGDVFLARVDGKPAGSAVLNWDDAEHWGTKIGHDNEAGYIHRFVTRDAFRGQQVGKQLLDWASNRAQDKGKKYLRLSCRISNKKLCEYYERLGFNQMGEIDIENATCALYQQVI